MSEHKITPEKVTRPIQLLAAWLTGLIIIDGSFLAAASYITKPEWAAGVLVIAAVINVPLFLVSIFLLQTKYRPEMQEDIFYSKYLENQYSGKQTTPKPVDVSAIIKETSENIINKLGQGSGLQREPIEEILTTSQIEQIAKRVGNDRSLSELYLRPEIWSDIVDQWEENETFIDDVNRLVEEGLIEIKRNDFRTCRLTELGEKVSKYAEKNGLLFAQDKEHKEWWEAQGKERLTKSSSRRAKAARR